MKTKIVVKALILNQNNEALLMTRDRNDDSRPGDQDFPGGGVDPGEDLSQAVCREIFEEAGLEIAIHDIELFYADTELTADDSTIRLVFWARVTDPQVKISFEHEDFRWVPVETVSREFTHRVYGKSVDYALEHGLFGAPGGSL